MKKGVRLSEPMIDVKQGEGKKKPKLTVIQKRRNMREAYHNQSEEEKAIHIEKIMDNATLYKDRSDDEKQRHIDIKNKYQTKKRKSSVRYRRKESRIVAATQVSTKEKYGVRTCNDCGREYSIYGFDGNYTPNFSKTKRTYCFMCRRKMNKAYYQKNKEKWAGINK